MVPTLRVWAVFWLSVTAVGAARSQADPKQKEIDRREEELIRRTAERSQRPVETERDKLLEELVKIPGPALPKDNFDPWFDSLAGNAGVWTVDANSPKTFREMHRRIAKHVGAGETVTREQFRRYASVNLQEKNSPAWRPPESTPEQEAERAFREGDRDRTRRLEEPEMSETLRGQWKKWDKDGDGLIDLPEYTAYYLARVAEGPATRTENGRNDTPAAAPAKPADPFDDEGRPMVVRFGKLPKGLPAWFMDWDTDHDGQIGLYEWRAASQPTEEFLKLDLNEDGFIEVEEGLKAGAQGRTPLPMVATSQGKK
jgi:Ca2+-binding EF-hand superfamily protein